MSQTGDSPILEVHGLAFGYGGERLQHDVSFDVKRGSIFAIMGASGSGKSTLLKVLIGLLRPSAGQIFFAGVNYCSLGDARRAEIGRHFGVLFQGGALWSSLTAAENVALPLEMFTRAQQAVNRCIGAFEAVLGRAGHGKGSHAIGLERRHAPARRTRPRASLGSGDIVPR